MLRKQIRAFFPFGSAILLMILALAFHIYSVPHITRAWLLGGVFLASLAIYLLPVVMSAIGPLIRPVILHEFVDQDYDIAIKLIDEAIKRSDPKPISVCVTNLSVPLNAIKDLKSFHVFRTKLGNEVRNGKLIVRSIIGVHDKTSAARVLAQCDEFKDQPHYYLKAVIRDNSIRPFCYNMFLIRDTMGVVTFESFSGSTSYSFWARKPKESQLLAETFDRLWDDPLCLELIGAEALNETNINKIRRKYKL